MCGRARLEPRQTSSYLKTPVFARPYEYDESPFSKKSPPWRAYLKTSVFGVRKRRLRVDCNRIRRKKSPFSKIPGYVWNKCSNEVKQKVNFSLSDMLQWTPFLLTCYSSLSIISPTNADQKPVTILFFQ